MKRAWITALSWLALAGCASLAYTPVTVDSPMPAALTSLAPCAGHLAPGTSCVALVRAENWYSDTGLRAKAGHSYCIGVPPGQVWFDAERRNSPPHGEIGSTLMQLMAWTKRQDAPWFTLMAEIIPEPALPPDPAASKDAAPTGQAKTSRPYNVATSHAPLRADIKGALALYPNDARGPAGRPGWFYENNSGQIWVQITHLQTDQACAGNVSP